MPHPDQNCTVSQLYFYPIKSCAGTACQTAEFDERGIKYDRGWGIIDDSQKVLTQREISKLALIKPTLGKETSVKLKLSAPGMPDIVVDNDDNNSKSSLKVKIWSDQATAIDEGVEVSKWLTEYLGTSARLVKMDDHEKRPVKGHKDNIVGFADGYPLLLISQESLDELNGALETPVKMNRFRPNIVVNGISPYEEDSWRQIKIGALTIKLVEPCARCVITTIEQETATKGPEPLKTLSRTRLKDNKTLFGQNCIHENIEKISIGDSVEVLL